MQPLALNNSSKDMPQGEPKESLRTFEHWTHLFCNLVWSSLKSRRGVEVPRVPKCHSKQFTNEYFRED